MYHSLRAFPLSDNDPDALASLCREGDQQVPHLIHISLPNGVVESQCWHFLFPGPIIEVILAEDAREEHIELGVCQIYSALGLALRAIQSIRMQREDLPHTHPGAFGEGH